MIRSQFFTEDELTATSSGIANIPDSEQEGNLQLLANLLDYLKTHVGDFNIESGFRSQAVQSWLIGGGAGADSAVQASPTSYHMQGKAADITPTGMTAKEFYAKLISDETLRNMMGEIALKKNTIHVSIPTPTKLGVPMIVNEAGQYIRYTVESALSAIGMEWMLGSSTGESSGVDDSSTAGEVVYSSDETDAPALKPVIWPYIMGAAGIAVLLLVVMYGRSKPGTP
jgi:hypothetical protein